jgi:NAD(P)-dependent dehydrogenase (short-subunit alcohol dehydrogenase family)
MAGVCAFLVSDDAAYITGHAILIDGGLTLRRGRPDRAGGNRCVCGA